MEVTRLKEIAEFILKNDPAAIAYVNNLIENLTDNGINRVSKYNLEYRLLNGAETPTRYARSNFSFITTHDILKVNFPEKTDPEIEKMMKTWEGVSDYADKLNISQTKNAYKFIKGLVSLENLDFTRF